MVSASKNMFIPILKAAQPAGLNKRGVFQIDLSNVDLLSLQAGFMKNDPTTIALCQALDPQFQQLADEVKCCLIYSRVAELDEPVLDELAWQMHIDWYDATLSVEKKRNLVKTSILIHQTRGTPYAVEQALSTIFDESGVSEWFDYGGDPYMFKVVTTDRVTSQISIDKLKKAINAVKNTRSWLESFTIQRDNQNQVYFGGFVHIGKTITVPAEGV